MGNPHVNISHIPTAEPAASLNRSDTGTRPGEPKIKPSLLQEKLLREQILSMRRQSK